MFKGEEKQDVAPWISSYPVEIVTVYMKLSAVVNFSNRQ